MINLLDPKVYNRIAAGEVVERPASVVKELVENSLDAGATNVLVSIEEGGKRSIEVSDNGCGIDKADLVLAFTPHATSKIQTIDDLDDIATLGFRGEALASIASVAQVNLSSKTEKADVGYALSVSGGEFGKVEEVARRKGTSLVVKNLFYNTPARAKFLRKAKLEEGEITHLIEKLILSHPEIAFTYVADGKTVYSTSKGDLKSAIYTIYGRSVYDALIEVNAEENGIALSGYVTKPTVCKSNRTYQSLFVNGRYVENYLVSQAVQGVYENFLMKGKFPIYVLNLTAPYDGVDVNVHPSKKEVKFENNSQIFGLVHRAVEKALVSVDQIAAFVAPDSAARENARDLYSPFNEQGFDPIIKPQERLSDREGSSYIKVDHFGPDEPLNVTPPKDEIEYEKAAATPLPPDFANVKIAEREVPINRPGAPVFFDQNVSSTLEQARAHQKGFLTASVKDEIKVLGTVFKTYIIAEYGDSIYFLDQHAGHERILYDRLVSRTDSSRAKQTLLAPFVFTIGAKEREILERQLPSLIEIGFDITNKGNTYTISALPLVLSGLNIEGFVSEMLREGVTYCKKPSQFIHEKLCQSACKHAIKAGDSLSRDDCAYLIEQVRKGVMLCPHGRPIALEMTRKELEKLFKRIV